MTQQNQQNPGQQVLLVLLRVSQANLSKIQPGKAKAAAGQRDQNTRHGTGLAIASRTGGESSRKRVAAVMMMRLTGSSGRMEKPCLLIWNGLPCWLYFQAALEAVA